MLGVKNTSMIHKNRISTVPLTGLSAEELRDLLAGLGYAWPDEALRRIIDFYFARMSHGSTLSRVVHAWVHARTDRAASWGCFTEALAADLHDTQGGTTREGIHLGAMAGTIDLAERCYLGLETREDALSTPACPKRSPACARCWPTEGTGYRLPPATRR